MYKLTIISLSPALYDRDAKTGKVCIKIFSDTGCKLLLSFHFSLRRSASLGTFVLTGKNSSGGCQTLLNISRLS